MFLGASCEVGESLFSTSFLHFRLLWQDEGQVALVFWAEARAAVECVTPFPRPWQTESPSERLMSIHCEHSAGPTHIASFIGSIFRVTYSTAVLARYLTRQGNYGGRPKSGRATLLFNLICIYGTAWSQIITALYLS